MNDQDQIDIGDDINERELDALERMEMGIDRSEPDNDGEPDERELAGAVLAQLGYVTQDLSDAVATLLDSDRDMLATDLHAIDHALLILGTIRDELAQALAALMEDEVEAIAGFAVKRTKSDKTEWDRDGAWRHVRFAIVDRWGGDDQDVQLIDRTLQDVKTVYTTLNPTVTGLKALAVDPYELRTVTPAARWQVKVTA